MELLNKDVKEATQKRFEAEMDGPVVLIYFTQEASRLIVPEHLRGQECLFCQQTRQLLEEVAGLSPKISLEIFDFVADKMKAAELGIDKIPGVAVRSQEDRGIRFFGIPSGYEYLSLIEAIIDVSKGTTRLSEQTKKALSTLTRNIRIQVFVTPTCPYCTSVVRLAHQFALESPWIRAEMVEATEFPHLAQKYRVFGVPKAVLNETLFIEGAVPEQVFLDHVLKAGGQERA